MSDLICMSNGQANAEITVDKSPTLTCLHEALQDNQSVASGHVIPEQTGVRRLTPLECERLQGMPDGWTKVDEKSSDTARYKAIGNSMALPCSDYVLAAIRRMVG